MTQVLRGNIVHAPAMGRLDILEHGCLVLEDGVITGLYPDLPAHLEGAEVRDFSDRIIMQSFADMHLHAPQYPMLGMGMACRCWTGSTPTRSPPRRGSLIWTTPAASTAGWLQT